DADGPILKLFRERSVWAPQYLSAGTFTSPMVSFSIRYSIIAMLESFEFDISSCAQPGWKRIAHRCRRLRCPEPAATNGSRRAMVQKRRWQRGHTADSRKSC